tara:strand:- start:449 stop:679 length:231 start_codon:yes stop_codon:yes gene_type:complete
MSNDLINEKRIYDSEQEHAHDMSYENETSTVTLTIREYDKLKAKQNYITDPSLISIIDKIEELTRALRKHIVRTDI